MFDPSLQAAQISDGLGLRWWLQSTQFVNFLFLGLFVRSGWEILASHPRLYGRNDCGPGTEWLKFNGRPVEPYYTVLTKAMAMEDETILAWA